MMNQEQLNFILTKYFINQGVVTSLMLDGTYLSRNLATLGPLTTQPPYEFMNIQAVCWGQINRSDPHDSDSLGAGNKP